MRLSTSQPRRRSGIVLICAAAVLLVSCASRDPMAEVRPLLVAGDTDAAIARLQATVDREPYQGPPRAALLRLREEAARAQLQAADAAAAIGDDATATAALERAARYMPGDPAIAEAQLQFERRQRARTLVAGAEQSLAKGQLEAALAAVGEALALQPGDRAAMQLRQRILRLADEQATAEAPQLRLLDEKPVTLEFREAPVKQLFEALSRSAGLSFVFDQDVRRDAKVTLRLQGVKVSEALRIIGQANRLAFSVLSDRALLVYPDTPLKRNEYRRLTVRAFNLSNAIAKDIAVTLRTVLRAREVTPDDKANMLVMRDTPEMIRMAERLIALHDIPDPEVMLEVEVLEVSRSALSKLGLVAPDAVSVGNPASTGGIVIGSNGIRASVANPLALINLKQRESATDLLANPRIRVKNKTKAKIHIGEKVPVVTTTATANVGVSSSVSYLDVGLRLDVEPTIHLDDEVSIGLKLEVSNIIETITVGSAGGGSTVAYRLGTRNTETNLRLKDGQTQVLAGLIQNDQRRSRSKIPLLSDLPIIGRLFSSDDGVGSTRSKTEVVLLITPRILRAMEPLPPDLARFSGGTLGDGGVAPLLLDSDAADAALQAVIVPNPTAAEIEAGQLATQSASETAVVPTPEDSSSASGAVVPSRQGPNI
jgi:general secretion pathway protein D